jgi:hypothetical protein
MMKARKLDGYKLFADAVLDQSSELLVDEETKTCLAFTLDWLLL